MMVIDKTFVVFGVTVGMCFFAMVLLFGLLLALRMCINSY